MQIPAVAALGLNGTAQAIQRGQSRFDQQARQVTADTLAQTSDQPGPDTGLTQDMVGMQADAISNSILYKVFQRQSEQQQELVDILRPN